MFSSCTTWSSKDAGHRESAPDADRHSGGRHYCLNIARILSCMLVNVTFSLPEETVKKLREVARRAGGKRGAISDLVDAALKEHLQEVEAKSLSQEFRASRGDLVVARAASLRELASLLEKRGISPRDVLIESSIPLPASTKTGLRRRID